MKAVGFIAIIYLFYALLYFSIASHPFGVGLRTLVI